MSDTESIQSELKLNTTNLNKQYVDKTESDSEESIAGGSDANSEEYEEYDLTDNPLYQVLSAFLEDDDGNNLCDHIQKLTEAVNNNSKELRKVLQSKESTTSTNTSTRVKSKRSKR